MNGEVEIQARKVAERIAKRWGLNDEQIQQLLADDMIRISHVFGIYKALRVLFPTEERANAWPAKPNRAFDGRSALEVMLSGDISTVRRYLDAQCQ